VELFIGDIIALLALTIAISSLVLTIFLKRKYKAIDSYYMLITFSEIILTLPIKDEKLNLLYYSNIDEKLPDPHCDFSELTNELRKLVHYGTIIFPFFECVYTLKKHLQRSFIEACESWLKMNIKCPRFYWVWERQKSFFSINLVKAINDIL